MSLTNLLVPIYKQTLRAMSGWLDKAQAQLTEVDAEALLSARLAPDMYPLSSQVCFVCLQAQEAVFRLRGETLPSTLDQLAATGRNAGEQPGNLADAKARIAQALSYPG